MKGSQGFPLNHSMDDTFIGIRVILRRVQALNGEPKEDSFVLLDSSGFNSPNSSPEIDRKIFIFLVMASSMQVFNLSGCLDEDVIYRLFESIKEF